MTKTTVRPGNPFEKVGKIQVETNKAIIHKKNQTLNLHKIKSKKIKRGRRMSYDALFIFLLFIDRFSSEIYYTFV